MPTPEQQDQIDAYIQTYHEMVGFVPPRIAARFARLAESNPELLLAQEHVRNLITYNQVLDQKTTQLVLTAVLTVQLRDAAAIHGRAALKAGATWEELQAVMDLAYLFGGTSVANHSPAFLDAIARLEEEHGA